jgi:hypothetical protein
MNLYLYMPSGSAHPPSCLKGLIASTLDRYWTQNNPTDFQDILSKIIYRLAERGHKLEHLIPLFKAASTKMDTTKSSLNQRNNKENDMLFYIGPTILMTYNARIYAVNTMKF